MEDDINFKQAMQGVKPLKSSGKAVVNQLSRSFSKPDDPAEGKKLTKAGIASRNETGASDLFFLRSGEQKKTLTRLRKAQFNEFDAEIDLHGYRGAQAEKALLAFLENCTLENVTYALIIHGKGHHSNGAPVIKQLCESLIMAHDYTVAYCSARPIDGGSGALYVKFNHPNK